jgi:DNA-binding transcriptional LysR family regulator
MIATPTEIEHFIEIYNTLHVSNAAIRLGITQPTLTQSLKRLEEKLKTALFIRTKQGVIATEAGTLFYTRAIALQENWGSLQTEIQKLKNEVSGTFKLGCHTAVGGYALPPLMSALNREAPGIELSLVHDFSRKITERLIAYEIDLAYVINPVRHRDLVLVKLGEDQVSFWKKKGLSNPPKRLLADQGLAQVESLLSKSQQKHFKDWTLLQTASLELIRTLTLDGQGVGILPGRIALSESSGLVPYNDKLPVFQDEIYLAYRKELLMSRAGKELIRLARISL